MPSGASKIPALPVPLDQANTAWPTFSLTKSEREAISAGKFTPVRPGVAGSIVTGAVPPVALGAGGAPAQPTVPASPKAAAPWPVVAPTPPAPAPTIAPGSLHMPKVRSSRVPKLPSSLPAALTPVSGPAPAPMNNSGPIILHPTSAASSSGVIRSTTPLGTSVSSSAAGSGGPVRSSVPSSASSSASGGAGSASTYPPSSSWSAAPAYAPSLVPARLLDTGAGKWALAAFISPLIALMAFFVGLAAGLVPLDLLVLFGTALFADISGIVALKIGRMTSTGRRLAGAGIFLGTFSILAEVLRIIIIH